MTALQSSMAAPSGPLQVVMAPLHGDEACRRIVCEALHVLLPALLRHPHRVATLVAWLVALLLLRLLPCRRWT